MKPRTSPTVLGFIWGIVSMMLTFAVFSVFASLKLVFIGFPLFSDGAQMQYILIGAVFLLSVLGAIGAAVVLRMSRLGGLFLLLSCVGVAALLFAPVIMQSFSFAPLEAYGIYLSPLVLLIADFSMVLLTAIGITGGILAFIPKRDRKSQLIPTAAVPAETAPLPIMPFAAQPEFAHKEPLTVQPKIAQAAPPVVQQEVALATPPPAAVQPDIVRAAPPLPDIELMNLE
jgi:hypothetical protein